MISQVSKIIELPRCSLKFIVAFLLCLFSFLRADAVTITSPANEAQFVLPTNIDITVSNAFDDISLVEFFEGATKIGESTLTPFNFTWTNDVPGSYTLTAHATDTNGFITVSAPVNIFVTTNSGTLLATLGSSASTVDLTSEGVTDWVHWGHLTENSVIRKVGVTPLISNFDVVGSAFVFRFDDKDRNLEL